MVNTTAPDAIKTIGHSDHQSGAFAGFNDDLLAEILLRLPATSILRFKSVSKHWRWLLSHRSFTMRFDRLSKCPGIFAIGKYFPFDVENRSFPPFRRLDFYLDPHGIKIEHSCNGLLLFRSRGTYRNGRFLLNPSIRKGNFFDSGVYWKGAIFLPPFDHNPFCFKLDVEQLQSLPLPSEMMSYDYISTAYYGESRGHLHLIANNFRERNSLRVNVYEILSDLSGWFVKYQVDLDQLADAAFPKNIPNYDYKVIHVVRGEKEEDTFIVLYVPVYGEKLFTVNVYDKSFKQIFPLKPYMRGGYSCSYLYIETLASF